LRHRNQELPRPFDEPLLVYGLEASKALGVLRYGTFGLLTAIETGVEKQRDRGNSDKRGRRQNPQAQTGIPQGLRDHVGRPMRVARRRAPFYRKIGP
jgi:hypothetical protein